MKVLHLSELQCGGYSACARTLRWMLETATIACEFQTDPNRSTYDLIIQEFVSIINENKKMDILDFISRNNAWIPFFERLHLYEEKRRVAPSFNELINTLNSRNIFTEAPQLMNEMKKIYHDLSRHVHLSTSKIRKEIDMDKDRRQSYPDYDVEDFETIYKLALKIIDALIFLYIKGLVHFFAFKDCKDLLMKMSDMIIFPEKPFSQLPFMKRLCKNISWKISQRTLKKIK